MGPVVIGMDPHKRSLRPPSPGRRRLRGKVRPCFTVPVAVTIFAC